MLHPFVLHKRYVSENCPMSCHGRRLLGRSACLTGKKRYYLRRRSCAVLRRVLSREQRQFLAIRDKIKFRSDPLGLRRVTQTLGISGGGMIASLGQYYVSVGCSDNQNMQWDDKAKE